MTYHVTPSQFASSDVGYLQFGEAGQPMETQPVSVRQRQWPHAGQWEARYDSRWRSVYVTPSRTYIKWAGQKITILIEGV